MTIAHRCSSNRRTWAYTPNQFAAFLSIGLVHFLDRARTTASGRLGSMVASIGICSRPIRVFLPIRTWCLLMTKGQLRL